MYRTIFCEEFNYSFHITKKDPFQTCAVYRNKEIAGELTTDLKIVFEYHIKRKNRARDEKKLDKSRAKQDKSYHVATFDLPIPCSLLGQQLKNARSDREESRDRGESRSQIFLKTPKGDSRDGYRGTGSVEDERGRDTGQDFEVMAYEDNGSVEGRRYPVRSMGCGNRSGVRVDSLCRLEAIQAA
ncbi:hypothetical protein DPMN_096338 [Dreissena polymorpha]|uniref:Uncharacterized protein n=1 Tax=Dreissena polymorpha TaxID=45954 RepID=A0A9D4L9K0_DREPO|nr:hypothetical protein DPMN_096338 [Dreissena polymorpha]